MPVVGQRTFDATEATMDIGIPELLIILAIIIILFGPARLAGAGRALGEAIRDFRRAVRDTPQDTTDPHKKAP
jgi:sec-independent protein translocase protein TatA